MENTTYFDLPVAKTSDEALKMGADIAAANFMRAQELIGARLEDPTITNKTLIDFAEHSFKASGLAKKQEDKAQGQRITFTINLGGSNDVRIEKDVTPQETLTDDAGELTNLLVARTPTDDAINAADDVAVESEGYYDVVEETLVEAVPAKPHVELSDEELERVLDMEFDL